MGAYGGAPQVLKSCPGLVSEFAKIWRIGELANWSISSQILTKPNSCEIPIRARDSSGGPVVPPHRPPRVVKCSLTLIQAFGSLLVAPTTHRNPPSVPNLTNLASTTDRSTHLRIAALAPSSQTTTDGMHDGLSWASGAESPQRAFCNHLGGPRSPNSRIFAKFRATL